MSYTTHDVQRRYTERPKSSTLPGARGDGRTPYARDRARVLHSAALRRLAGKTQVVGPGEGAEVSGVPRTRLTHSLEVAQISRGIAADLGADPDLCDTAGLAHDIGHPPFGHNGEAALDEAARACGGFEGNAQTLRILTRLEPKVLGEAGEPYGLNLTRACLDATMKYPWPRRDGQRKFGVYADDLDAFTWIRSEAPGEDTCLEAQIMDWADDVAYSVHDVEDGVLAGRISLPVLADAQERAALAGLAAEHFCALSVATVEGAALGLLELPAVADLVRTPYDGSPAAQAALKRMTSELVGRFVSAAVTGTRAVHGEGPLSRYGARLEVPDQVAAEVALLKALALRYVMSDRRRLAVQEGQRQLLLELVETLLRRSPEALDVNLRPAWDAASDDAARVRVVVDQVASLTDAQAKIWHSWHLGRHG
ncbi:deoxyguanosinetriphosphate triphosphohydrolase [Saccharomonospora viridis]|uniref:Deoxyguanosinetriphosphate triphosphohydrolase-like protein n=1 Tax=Saccharomonospora viridis (strain ATCC 15386 / DSM 43017 / JCM 3036 / CCUG 5913 / NBRC 12207 / NCIMB 9602 / P101) TaxID=471857 RepID=C7MQC5_SACVD|nr:deoxyguanosinetriphosphate triphosphohydrolase [Saccharomonospora viridis]ACU96424.1 deoxyguanosinetriphosphate triphosphohydrolase, putative [Saccharomonospora viridis DSM 43017]